MPITRGEMLDKITNFAVQNKKNWDALLANPKGTAEKVLGFSMGTAKVSVVLDTPETVHIVLPFIAKEGSALSDEDLETVAGGFLDAEIKTCLALGGNASQVVI